MTQFRVAMLVCAELRRSRDFYRDVLGLKVRTDNSPHWVDFDLGSGASLVLHQRSELLAVRPGSLQLGFTVESVDSFVADCAALSVPVFQDPYDETSGRVAVIGDPDGYPIQIVSASRTRRAKA
ncbi:MAG TPA: VOC family protein [Candidatus Baltobacteraceae bacterium]|nr:VOC family protein [Candidatus Baltobacteraceae bacterium]